MRQEGKRRIKRNYTNDQRSIRIKKPFMQN